MKTLYFDCNSGISGNMTLGALLEITEDTQYLLNELKKLKIKGYNIQISKKQKNGITATYVDVILEDEHNHNSTAHLHNHEHRNLNDINEIIEKSELSETVKDLAKRIFLRVAKAESKVHGKTLEEVHFHEVGAIDSIIDICGTAILIDKINPEQIISSTVNDGYGFTNCAHGKMAIPVPATSEIFATSKVKFRQIDIEGELVTPTGAAIIAELSKDFKLLPKMNIKKIGWGAGTKDLEIPNVLKIYYGETEEKDKNVTVIETNIDDSTSEILGYTQEQLLKNGALDVFFTPILMKKNRPSYKLTVICKNEDLSKMQDIIFKETTTIGIRYRQENRIELPRKIIDLETKYGVIKAKKVKHGEEEYIYPEYENIKKLAEEKNIPLKELYKLGE